MEGECNVQRSGSFYFTATALATPPHPHLDPRLWPPSSGIPVFASKQLQALARRAAMYRYFARLCTAAQAGQRLLQSAGRAGQGGMQSPRPWCCAAPAASPSQQAAVCVSQPAPAPRPGVVAVSRCRCEPARNIWGQAAGDVPEHGGRAARAGAKASCRAFRHWAQPLSPAQARSGHGGPGESRLPSRAPSDVMRTAETIGCRATRPLFLHLNRCMACCTQAQGDAAYRMPCKSCTIASAHCASHPPRRSPQRLRNAPSEATARSRIRQADVSPSWRFSLLLPQPLALAKSSASAAIWPASSQG
jgi:hypothetical protein